MTVVTLTSLSAIGLLATTLTLPVDQGSPMPQTDKVPVQFASTPRPPAAPDGAGGWSMLIATRGGLADGSNSDFVVTSAGSVTCGGDPCQQSLDARDLTNLSSLVRQSWPALVHMSSRSICSDCPRTLVIISSSICSDCPRRLVIIRRRDDAGVEQTYIVSWDVTTQGSVAPEFLNLISAVTSLFPLDSRR